MGTGALGDRALGSGELRQDLQGAAVEAWASRLPEPADRKRGRAINIGEDIVTRTLEPESFDELLEDLTKEIEVHNYRVTRIYDIDNILEQPERGIDATITFERYKIVEFCNLGSCAELISQELLAGVFMPVRFIVYRKAGASDVSISFLKPSAFSRRFDSPRLTALATELERDMTEVLDELAF